MNARNCLTWLGMVGGRLLLIGCVCSMVVVLSVCYQMRLFVPPQLSPNARQLAMTEEFSADARTCWAAINYLLTPEVFTDSDASMPFQKDLGRQANHSLVVNVTLSNYSGALQLSDAKASM